MLSRFFSGAFSKALLFSVGICPAVAAQDRDCRDFDTWEQAQSFYKMSGRSDPHHLDSDGNGIACETLQLVGAWRITSQCRGRRIEAEAVVRHIGRYGYAMTIRNNYGEVSQSSMRRIYSRVEISSEWSDGSTTTATGRLSPDAQRISGKDSLGCGFEARKR